MRVLCVILLFHSGCFCSSAPVDPAYEDYYGGTSLPDYETNSSITITFYSNVSNVYDLNDLLTGYNEGLPKETASPDVYNKAFTQLPSGLSHTLGLMVLQLWRLM